MTMQRCVISVSYTHLDVYKRQMLDCAEAVTVGALARKESRGAHQRLDYVERDDKKFLRHTMAYFKGLEPPRIDYLDVVITKSPPGVRDYSGDHK